MAFEHIAGISDEAMPATKRIFFFEQAPEAAHQLST
jgi:hypothetical protein